MLWESFSSSYTEQNKIEFLQFLDFSVILYRFYKLLVKHNKGGRIILRVAPWNFSKDHRYAPSLHQTSWNYLGLCNVVQGARGGAAGRIPARPAAGLAGEVARVEEGFTLARLVTGVWAETSPASSRGGGRGRRQCRRCTGREGWLGGRRGSRDAREGVEVVGR
jgi:hypothetical protein